MWKEEQLCSVRYEEDQEFPDEPYTRYSLSFGEYPFKCTVFVDRFYTEIRHRFQIHTTPTCNEAARFIYQHPLGKSLDLADMLKIGEETLKLMLSLMVKTTEEAKKWLS